jgi:hypothetical protein
MESGNSSPFQEARPVVPTKALTGQRTPGKMLRQAAPLATFITFPFRAFHLSCAATTARVEDSARSVTRESHKTFHVIE